MEILHLYHPDDTRSHKWAIVARDKFNIQRFITVTSHYKVGRDHVLKMQRVVKWLDGREPVRLVALDYAYDVY